MEHRSYFFLSAETKYGPVRPNQLWACVLPGHSSYQVAACRLKLPSHTQNRLLSSVLIYENFCLSLRGSYYVLAIFLREFLGRAALWCTVCAQQCIKSCQLCGSAFHPANFLGWIWVQVFTIHTHMYTSTHTQIKTKIKIKVKGKGKVVPVLK
jgi:hypothetical protein